MIEENSGPSKSVPLSEVFHLVSVPLSEVLLYYVDRSNNFKLPKLHPKCFYNINAVKKRLCLCIGLS